MAAVREIEIRGRQRDAGVAKGLQSVLRAGCFQQQPWLGLTQGLMQGLMQGLTQSLMQGLTQGGMLP